MNVYTNTQQINQAIKKAINEDATLSKLIVAKEFPGNVLVIESLIDGVRTNADLELNFTKADDTADTAAGVLAYTTAELAGAAIAWEGAGAAAYANTAGLEGGTGWTDLTAVGFSGAAGGEQYSTGEFVQVGAGPVDVVGAVSGAESDNLINAGAGNDVIVLGTGVASNDIVVLSGNFGHNKIVNFDSAALSAKLDMLDFTSYLVNSSTAAVAETVSFSNKTAALANVADDEITIIAFSDLDSTGGTAGGIDSTAATPDTLLTITAAKIQAELTANVANIGTTSDAGEATEHVFLIHDDSPTANTGHYLVVTATTTAASDALGNVQIVGSLDFGDALDGTMAIANIVGF